MNKLLPHPTKKKVLGTGPLNAKIVLIGEAPGAEEHAAGLPFVGQAGKFLDVLLSNAGIGRDECYHIPGLFLV